MGRNILLALIIAALMSGCRNNMTVITGILENPVPREYIFLQELNSNELLTVDSVIVDENGGFEFKRRVKIPSFYLLKVNQNNFMTMLVEPGEKIKMTSHHDSLSYPVVVTGSKGTKLMADYYRNLLKTINKIKTLSDIHDRNLGRPDFAAVIDSLDNLGNMYLNEMNSYAKKFIDENISSLATLVVVYSQVAPNVYVLNPEKDYSYFVKVDSALFKNYPDYGPVAELHKNVSQLVDRMGTGKDDKAGTESVAEAPEIALPTPEGDTVRLSSTRGSFVLLDFWASWCSPCRAENPNLVNAYTLYHKKGFQIFQVSLDKTREPWVEAIKTDGLEKWIHVSDLKYWNSAVVPRYKIESIPSNFLLDKEGHIIASNLRGDALQRKLAELFK